MDTVPVAVDIVALLVPVVAAVVVVDIILDEDDETEPQLPNALWHPPPQ